MRDKFYHFPNSLYLTAVLNLGRVRTKWSTVSYDSKFFSNSVLRPDLVSELNYNLICIIINKIVSVQRKMCWHLACLTFIGKSSKDIREIEIGNGITVNNFRYADHTVLLAENL